MLVSGNRLMPFLKGFPLAKFAGDRLKPSQRLRVRKAREANRQLMCVPGTMRRPILPSDAAVGAADERSRLDGGKQSPLSLHRSQISKDL
jgi:hypothetical protein